MQPAASKPHPRACRSARKSSRARPSAASAQRSGRGVWPVAWLRRSRPRPARRAGGRRCRHSRPGQCSARAQRLQKAHAGAAGGVVRAHLRAGPGRGGDAVADRPRQYFTRVVMGAGACRRGAAGATAPGFCRWPRSHQCRLRLRGSYRRRRARRLDRGGLDRRRSDARPLDGLPTARPIPATASSAIWAIACRNVTRARRLGPTIHHRRSFAPVANSARPDRGCRAGDRRRIASTLGSRRIGHSPSFQGAAARVQCFTYRSTSKCCARARAWCSRRSARAGAGVARCADAVLCSPAERPGRASRHRP